MVAGQHIVRTPVADRQVSVVGGLTLEVRLRRSGIIVCEEAV